jgi:RHS repeat-associated protein
MVKDNAEGITSISWTVYGKISKISKNSGTDIIYTYDASGNRISKSVIKTATGDTTTTWYVRDAQGNVMSVYSAGDITLNSGHLSQTELHLYGSSRLGILQASVDVAGESAANDTSLPILNKGYTFSFVRGSKLFELSNHLGNVLVTLNDKKIGVTASSGDTTIDHFIPQIVSAQDYYPFGMLQPGRSYNVGGYRFGFNGKENDNEVKGLGNQIDYGARVYDPRIGKFLSVDPLCDQYPWYTPYQFAGNSPIANVDIDGKEEEYYELGTNAKTGKSQLSLTKVVNEKSILWGAISWKPELERFVEYKGQTYIFGNDAEDNSPKDFDAFTNNPENFIKENEGVFFSKEKSDEDFLMQAGTVVLMQTVSTYQSFPRKGSPTTPATQQEASTQGPKTAPSRPAGQQKAATNPRSAANVQAQEEANVGVTQQTSIKRVKPRKGTLEQVEKNQPRNDKGQMIDPNTKKPLKKGQIDLGHKPGEEWRKRKEMHEQRGSTREEVIEAENDPNLYQLEDRSSNRSHKHEKKD